ncbi:MAG: hypothetical protein IKJ43_04635 [Bacilli bacterium]|nr:hypothetical protein [Bacilli bacterium]
MRNIEEIEELINQNYKNTLLTKVKCERSNKTTSKFTLGTFALGLASLAIFSGVSNVLDGSSLVLACTPSIVAMVGAGTLSVMSNNRTNKYYSQLHDLDVERFDLNLELQLSKKEIINQAIESKDFSDIDDNLIEEASKEDLVALSQALIEENNVLSSDNEVNYHSPKKIGRK